ncbi:hypothetical protein [Alloactinosynnema sp. L-07]|uniref:hypothetical protein n=1 Tax=Alloactinosynnema sp. L-07 TaxID=1653480 RepID=UPI00065EF526|nr:hypothetical protein [Alloactinosynnema sp. L-07]CRK58195.1 hypothetical protein [Alloactinosynnema sp. L-07]
MRMIVEVSLRPRRSSFDGQVIATGGHRREGALGNMRKKVWRRVRFAAKSRGKFFAGAVAVVFGAGAVTVFGPAGLAQASISDPTGEIICTYIVTNPDGLNLRTGYSTGFPIAKHLNKGDRFEAYRDLIVWRDYDWRLVESHPEWVSYGIYAATGANGVSWMSRDTRYPCYAD